MTGRTFSLGIILLLFLSVIFFSVHLVNATHIVFDENITEEDLLNENDFILTKEPDNLTAWKYRALILYNACDYKEAINASNHCIALSPTDSYAYHIIGSSWANLGDSKRSIDAYQKSIEENPNDPVVYNVQGVAMYRNGDYEEAQKMFLKAGSLNDSYAVCWNNLGLTYDALGQTDDALDAFNIALSKNKDLPVIHLNKGYVLLEKGDYQQVISSAKASRIIDPTFTPGFFLLGEAYFSQNDWKNALVSYDGGFSAEDNEKLWYYKGNSDLKITTDMEPVNLYLISLAEDVRFNGAWDASSVVEYKLMRYHDTLDIFDQMLTITPDKYKILLNQGYCALKLEKYDTAKDIYSKILDKYPDNYEVLAGYGLSCTKLGDFSGIDYVDKAVSINPEYGQGYAMKGKIYDGYGKEKEAKDAFMEALKYNSSDSGINMDYATFCRHQGDWINFLIYYLRSCSGFIFADIL